MPSLADHHSTDFIKALYIGDSGTGKTGSLTSLVAAGYKVRVLDMDNNLSPLVQFVHRECPDKAGNVDFETRRDKYKATALGAVVAGTPKAFVDSLQLMTKWSDGTDPAEWGANSIFVLDSLTAFGRAAFEWARGMNPTAREPRTWFYGAQQAIENVIALLSGEAFHSNVIVISHVDYREMQEGQTKGFPKSIGAALGPALVRYFPTMILAESSGSGKNVKRKIKTVPTGIIDLKNPAPFKVEAELPLETGMATLFKLLKEK